MRYLLSLFTLFALLSVSRISLAQAGEGDARRAAYREGYAAMQAKKWDEAYAIFGRLWRDSPSYDVALHLGHAEFNLGKNRDAAEHLAFGIAHLPPGEAKDLADSSRRALERVKEEVGTITLIVDRSGAAVRVDDKPAGTTPIDVEIFVDPGDHVVEASLDGYEPAKQTFQIARGEHQNIVLKLDPLPPATTAEPDTSPSTSYSPIEEHRASKARPIAIWTGVGVTVAAGVTTLVFALKGSSASNRADDARAQAAAYGPNACASPMAAPADVCASLKQANDDRASANRIANIALAVTGVAAVATATMFFVWPRTTTSQAAITLTPTATRSSGALLINGTFN
jgi:hypothetical protein